MACLIPNCNNEAIYYIGIRLRRPADAQRAAGTAIWAPDTDANLCAAHAAQGYTIDINLTPVAGRTITTNVSAGGAVVTRTTNIIHNP
jgi:hypothetical protein